MRRDIVVHATLNEGGLPMPPIKIVLDQMTYEKLVAIAFRELRPTPWQAEILLRRAIQQDTAPTSDNGNVLLLATEDEACLTDKG